MVSIDYLIEQQKFVETVTKILEYVEEPKRPINTSEI
jgi:hypothetical protein